MEFDLAFCYVLVYIDTLSGVKFEAGWCRPPMLAVGDARVLSVPDVAGGCVHTLQPDEYAAAQAFH